MLNTRAHTYTCTHTRTQAESALKQILSKCTELQALLALLAKAPPHILEHVVVQFSKVLPKNPSARKMFISTGGLRKVSASNLSH